ncbi:MmyB family transcriptional regulator [Brachybacterium sp. DNPG3]
MLGPRMEVLAGNALAWALLEDFPSRAADDRNLLRWVATDPRARSLYRDWDEILSDLVGVLQLEASSAPRDARIGALVEELSTSAPEFARLWGTPRPTGRTCGTKRFRHPSAGDLQIDWEAFTVPDEPTQTLFVYTASDAPSSAALARLVSVGPVSDATSSAGPASAEPASAAPGAE